MLSVEVRGSVGSFLRMSAKYPNINNHGLWAILLYKKCSMEKSDQFSSQLKQRHTLSPETSTVFRSTVNGAFCALSASHSTRSASRFNTIIPTTQLLSQHQCRVNMVKMADTVLSGLRKELCPGKPPERVARIDVGLWTTFWELLGDRVTQSWGTRRTSPESTRGRREETCSVAGAWPQAPTLLPEQWCSPHSTRHTPPRPVPHSVKSLHLPKPNTEPGIDTQMLV